MHLAFPIGCYHAQRERWQSFTSRKGNSKLVKLEPRNTDILSSMLAVEAPTVW